MNNEYKKWIKSKNVLEEDRSKLLSYNELEIKKSFEENLRFGTAGIRVHMGLGKSLLNKYTIKMIAYAWIMTLKKNKPDVLKKHFLIAHDSRNNGKEFALIVAQVISGLGYKVYLIHNNNIVPTPIVSFAIRDLKLAGGACITASHNPPIFNGFKCFTQEGQHLMKRDSEPIAKELENIDINTDIPISNENIEYLDKDFENYYLEKTIENLNISKKVKKIKIVFSPQHGASYKLGPKVLRDLNFDVYEVERQSIPDGNFPYSPDPNPENPIAFKEMISLGKKIKAELLLTTDPDADRVAVGSFHNGKYYLFNGHEMASIVTYYILDKLHKDNKITKEDSIIKSIVTTTLVDEIACDFNVKVQKTLTGYNYIGEAVRQSSKVPLLTTEESYGSSICPNISLDKDSIQLLPLIASLANECLGKNITLVDYLHSIYKKYSWYIHKNESLVLESYSNNSREKINKFINYFSNIKQLGNLNVKKIIDFRKGYKDFDKVDLIIVYFHEGSWIASRPSGTEAKVRKYYCLKGETETIVNKKYDFIKKEIKKIEEDIFDKESNDFEKNFKNH